MASSKSKAPRALDEPEGDPAPAVRIDWQQVLQQHERWLRTVVFARVGDAQAVDDVMQEVALAAVRQAAPLTDPGKAAPWLYRIAIRQALLYRRGCGRRRKLTDRYVQQVPPDDAEPSDPLSWLLAEERRRLVRAALEDLAEADAEILFLKYTEGWTYHQIADHLGVSHSAVEARLHRARKRLRQVLSRMAVIEVK